MHCCICDNYLAHILDEGLLHFLLQRYNVVVRMYVCSGKLLGWVNAWVTEEFGQKLGAITACFVNCFEYSRIPLLQKLD